MFKKPLYIPHGFEGEFTINDGTQFPRLAGFVSGDSIRWVAIAGTNQNSFLSADGDTLYLANYGGVGGSDGQNADSINGRPIRAFSPITVYKTYGLVWHTDSTYLYYAWMPPLDTTGVGDGLKYDSATRTIKRVSAAGADSSLFATKTWVSDNTNQFDTTWFDGGASGWAFITDVPPDGGTHAIVVEALEGGDAIILDVKGDIEAAGEIQEQNKDVVVFGQAFPDTMLSAVRYAVVLDTAKITTSLDVPLFFTNTSFYVDSVVAVHKGAPATTG